MEIRKPSLPNKHLLNEILQLLNIQEYRRRSLRVAEISFLFLQNFFYIKTKRFRAYIQFAAQYFMNPRMIHFQFLCKFSDCKTTCKLTKSIQKILFIFTNSIYRSLYFFFIHKFSLQKKMGKLTMNQAPPFGRAFGYCFCSSSDFFSATSARMKLITFHAIKKANPKVKTRSIVIVNLLKYSIKMLPFLSTNYLEKVNFKEKRR